MMIRRALQIFAVLLLCSTLGAAAPPAKPKQPKHGLEYWSAYIPRNLDECFVQLKKKLDPAVLNGIRKCTEQDMAGYHFGLGMTLRNGWGLWQRSRLAAWFNSQGIYHPDDMSATILKSFWRYLHHQPIKLQEQVYYYQAYWMEARQDETEWEVASKEAEKKIVVASAGATYQAGKPQSVKMQPRRDGGLRVRHLAVYRGGVFASVRRGFCESFTTPGYLVDLKTRTMRPIQVKEIEQLRYAVVAGKTAYFCGRTGGRPILVGIGPNGRSVISLPVPAALPQLGIDGDRVMAVYGKSIYVLEGRSWNRIYSGPEPLPRSGPPPRRFGDTVYLRDEGDGENRKRLWLLRPLDTPPLVTLEREMAAAGGAIQADNCFSYCVTPDGDLWATQGEGYSSKSLVRRSANGGYRYVVTCDSVDGASSLDLDQKHETGPSISAIVSRSDGSLLGVGDHGVFRIAGNRISRILRVTNAKQEIPIDGGKNIYHWGWDPSDILELGNGSFVVSGAFGGVYLFERLPSGVYRMVSLDEKIGKPVRL